MKKLISILLAITITVATLSALAETFSVRGNISFSTTRDEIISIEEGLGSVMKISPTGNDFYTENSILCEGITFANIDDTDVIYYFNDKDELVSIMYMFAWLEDKNAAIEQYDVLNAALESKYGESIASGDKYLTINTDDGVNDVIDYETSTWFNIDMDGVKKTVDPMYFEQRLFALDDGYVDIKITLFDYTSTWIANMGSSKIPIDIQCYPIAISYTYCTEEHLQAIENSIQAAQDALDSDL